MLATDKGKIECVQVLLDAGANVDKQNKVLSCVLCCRGVGTRMTCLQKVLDCLASLLSTVWPCDDCT